jgi:2-succinyl-5-enolpyruvyl-6-hydroxy-3-cyclohexene-1-carboxylate synthase
MLQIDRANTNSLWCSVLAETLSRCGLQYVVVSPGSRSTPLTMAFARHNSIEAIPVLDERSAGFFALGLAKQTHKPVALVCTSGTAAVNYFPAVVEASEARIPLLVLTADRPPELRDCGAGQTINQIRLYGDFPVHQEEMAIPDFAEDSLVDLKARLIHAYGKSLKGPVHLNCPFRDPLPPIADESTVGAPEIGESFFADIGLCTSEGVCEFEGISINSGKGIIICGTDAPLDPEAYCRSVAALSEVSGWPVLADGLSPVRNFASLQHCLITSYDLILRNDSLGRTLLPEYVIALGPLPTSKRLREWLTEADVKLYHVHQTGKNLDPTGSVAKVVDLPVTKVVECFNFGGERNAAYQTAWSQAQTKVSKSLGTQFGAASTQGFEGTIAWLLPQMLPERTPVFVASSMPVRDVEYFWPPNDKRIKVFASRGANGIDGTLSTALGVAHGNQPTVLLTGDLAFLHDSNGLLIRPKFKGHLTVILVNNRGGGIFSHLPVSRFEPPFEEFFATPQEVKFKQLIESTGCEYLKLDSILNLAELLNPLPKSGIRVIEIETDRHRDSEYRKQLFSHISQSFETSNP